VSTTTPTADMYDVSARRLSAVSASRCASLHRVLVFGLCGLLSFGPLAFGATEAWSIAVLETGAAALMAIWVLKQLVLQRVKLRANVLFAPMALLAAVVVFQLATGLTAYREITLSRALLMLAFATIIFLVVHTLRSDRDLKFFARWFSVYGFLLALFAIIQGFTDKSGRLYWMRTPRSVGWTYGPYVDHSHYAGLMAMLIPLPLVMAVLGVEHGAKRTLLWMAAGTMIASMFLSQSRGGVLALFIELGVLATIAVRRTTARRYHRRAFAIIAAAILFLLFVGWLGGEAVLQRFSMPHQSELAVPGRTQILRDSLRMIVHKPLTGWGLGTYPLIFPQYRTFYTSLFVNHAHNDYVEFISETGVLGAAAIVWFLLALYRSGLSKIRARQSRTIDMISLASLTACTGIVAHSFWDFNVQIPANAAFFFAMCALASSDLTAPRVREHADSTSPRTSD
jgi:O-antigen ligase/polysaccharide polymerase Wzy-like membrane protein